MNIGEVAERCGVPAKTIRYYEDIGLVTPTRSKSGYREFNLRDMHKLAFVGRARAVGFSIEECRTLLTVYDKRVLTASDKQAIASEFVADIDQKIAELDALARILRTLLDCGQFDKQTDSAFADGLAHQGEIECKKLRQHRPSRKRDHFSLEN